MRYLCALCMLFGCALSAVALDREAFTFTNYDLKVRIEPEQERLGVRGKITLRNDSSAPQKNLALQISSTLTWRSIQIDGKAVQFETHEYNSDIDHTGALSEAIVALPGPIAPGGTIELEIGYEGTIPLDTTRLTRIGVPASKAKTIDWDRISPSFSAVRGMGYVTWYPVAAEAANLSDGNAVADTVGRWIARQAETKMQLSFESTSEAPIYFSGSNVGVEGAGDSSTGARFHLDQLGVSVPAFVSASYLTLPRKNSVEVGYFAGEEENAKDFADVAGQISPAVTLPGGVRELKVLGLPEKDDAPYVTQGMFLFPLGNEVTNQAELDMVYAIARQEAPSRRAWIQEGLARFAQAEFIEDHSGLQAALDYLQSHMRALTDSAKDSAKDDTARALINAPDDLYLQAKSMFVWWMLKDMLGKLPQDALLRYRSVDDKDASYMPRLLTAGSKRDLEWFFNDWLYHDRGLPDFRITSVYPRALDNGRYLVTITIENTGRAGAEVPVVLTVEGGEVRQRAEVRAQSKLSLRIEASSKPLQVVVNDGSVPESDMSNNTYKIDSFEPQKR